MRDKSRSPELKPEDHSARQREVYDRIVAGPRGAVEGPLKVWLASPDLADMAQALGAFIRYGTRLSPKLSELAILVTARIWSSGFEWSHHAPIAAQAGLSADVIASLGAGQVPELAGADAAVFRTTVEIHRDRRLSDETFDFAVEMLGHEGLVELIGLCGYYGLISMTINAFEVPDGDGPVLPDLALAPEAMFR